MSCNSGATFLEAPLIWIVLVVLDCVPSVPPVKSTAPERAPAVRAGPELLAWDLSESA